MIFTIKVTQDDIDDGIACDSYNCPIAEAINRLLLPNIYANVFYSVGFFHNEENLLIDSSLPQEAKKFARAFDDYEDCKPFEFELDIPENLVLTRVIRETY